MGQITFHEAFDTNLAFEEIFGTDTSFVFASVNTAIFRNLTGDYLNAAVHVAGTAIFAGKLSDNTYIASAGFAQTGTYSFAGSTIASLSMTDGDPDNLVDFAGALRGAGGLAAFDALFSKNDTITGGGKNDHLTTYGLSSTDTLDGGGGDDILWNRGQANAQMTGGAGKDVFRLATGASNVVLAGDAADGTGTAGDTDTLVIEGTGIGFLSITQIDALRFASSGGSGGVTLRNAQVGTGLVSQALTVEGSASQGDTITLARTGTGAADLDLSGWRFFNWGRLDQAVTFRFDDDAGAPQTDRVTGTVVDDVILMGAGADTVTGGRGADLLIGGDGDDMFVFNAGDVVAGERVLGGGGVDTLRLAGDTDMSLMRLSEIEQVAFGGAQRVWFNDSVPQGPLTILGDARFNEITVRSISSSTIDLRAWSFTGWSDADKLYVAGSAGSDVFLAPAVSVTADGGYGHDTLIGAAGSDRMSGASGDDRLDGANGSDFLDGGAGLDRLSGGAGNDRLAGGYGNDVLFGGYGKDSFVFDTRPAQSNFDRITDFSVMDDTIQLARAVFTKIARKGALVKEAFYIGTKAHDADDRIVYNKKTGVIFYDADGSGQAAAVAFARVKAGLALTEKDFYVL